MLCKRPGDIQHALVFAAAEPQLDIAFSLDKPPVYQQVKLTHAQDSVGTAVLWASSNDRASVENLAMDAFVEPLCEAVRQLSWNDARYISDALFRTLYESSRSYTELQFYIIAAVARLQDIHAAAGNGGPDRSSWTKCSA